MSQLSVYDQEELVEKSAMLAELQNISLALQATQSLVKDTINEQKQVLEKYMRETEESFNNIRQNIYKKKQEDAAMTVAPTHTSNAKKNSHDSNKGNKGNQNEWITVVKKKKRSKKIVPSTSTSFKLPSAPKTVNREVAPDLFIQAVTINNIRDCHRYPGWWCWSESRHQFCISINQKVILGNTTLIRPVSETPRKFFEHRRAETTDYTTCDFYIPRERNPASKDLREFTGKMRFVPASRQLQQHEAYCFRRGSTDTLKNDILSVKPEDYRLFNDLTCNFMLCFTAASNEMERRQTSGME